MCETVGRGRCDSDEAQKQEAKEQGQKIRGDFCFEVVVVVVVVVEMQNCCREQNSSCPA